MSKTFITSDTHFGHKRIIPLQARPFRDVEEMDAALIANWNTTVQPEDTVYHLGDFSFGGKEALAHYSHQLNGHIVLVCGNHDYDPKTSAAYGNFEFVTKDYCVMYRGRPILMTHRPLDLEHVWGRFRSRYQPTLLFGHIHTNGLKDGEDGKVVDGKIQGVACAANMGVELWRYRPVELGAVVEYIWNHPELEQVVLPEHTKEFQFE